MEEWVVATLAKGNKIMKKNSNSLNKASKLNNHVLVGK
jgi:hypothetical protein